MFPTPSTRIQIMTWWQYWLAASIATALTALSARFSVHVPFTPVPVTLQVLAVMLTGLLLGPRAAFAAQAQYLLLGAVGMPIFSGGAMGSVALLGFTGGYLLSYPFAAAVISAIVRSDRRFGNLPVRQLAGCIAGLGVIYLCGCSWLAVATQRPSFLHYFRER